MTENIAEAIIQNETNPVRFEEFCRELLQKSEGIALVPTSYNYDQARDARSISHTSGTHEVVLCVTLDSNIDDKVAKDATKLASTSHPERVIYCYSKLLTEYAIDRLTAILRGELAGTTSVTFLALKQLASLAVQHPDTLEKFYRSGLQAIEAALTRFEKGTGPDDTGLRLALMTLASEDARLLREEISQNAVLHVLHMANGPLAVEAIAL